MSCVEGEGHRPRLPSVRLLRHAARGAGAALLVAGCGTSPGGAWGFGSPGTQAGGGTTTPLPGDCGTASVGTPPAVATSDAFTATSTVNRMLAPNGDVVFYGTYSGALTLRGVTLPQTPDGVRVLYVARTGGPGQPSGWARTYPQDASGGAVSSAARFYVAAGADGSVYVTGETVSAGYDFGSGVIAPSSLGSFFIERIVDGNSVWAHTLPMEALTIFAAADGGYVYRTDKTNDVGVFEGFAAATGEPLPTSIRALKEPSLRLEGIGVGSKGELVIAGASIGTQTFGSFDVAAGDALVAYDALGNARFARNIPKREVVPNARDAHQNLVYATNGDIYLTGGFGEPSFQLDDITLQALGPKGAFFVARIAGDTGKARWATTFGETDDGQSFGDFAGSLVALDDGGVVFSAVANSQASTVISGSTFCAPSNKDVVARVDGSGKLSYALGVDGPSGLGSFVGPQLASDGGAIFVLGDWSNSYVAKLQ